jgi:hypothetical protein
MAAARSPPRGLRAKTGHQPRPGSRSHEPVRRPNTGVAPNALPTATSPSRALVDLRYLGLTLIGVFLALAIGLMTGSALGSPERQAAAFQGLRNQFEELRLQNQQVRDESDAVRRRLAAREQAMRDLLPLAVRGRLPGSTIGVVLCGGLEERSFWGDLESALKAAGAAIGPVIRIPDEPRPVSPSQRRLFESYWRADSPPPEASRFDPAGWVVAALTRPGQEDRLRELASATGIEVRGDFSQPVRRILVLASASEERAEAIAAGEVPEKWVVDAALADPEVRAVAAEPEETDGTALESLRRRGVPTVDCIDRAQGQIAAILALAGRNGSFGSKPGSGRALPPLEP